MLQAVEDFEILPRPVADYTKTYAVLSEVLRSVRDGWGVSSRQGQSDTSQPFVNAQTEICELQGILLRDCRVVLPQKLQSKGTDLLHTSHPGIVRMKAMTVL